MKNLFSLILALSILSGCSGSSGGGGASKTYALFPANYLSSTYSESYTLAGRDTFFVQYEGTYELESQTEATFNSSAVIPSYGLLDFTNKLTGGSFTIPSTTYYSNTLTNLEVLGFYDSLQDLGTVSSSPSVIPETAKVGDFGDIGTYTDNAGNTSIYTWELTKAKSGKAYFTIEGSVTDQFNELTGTIENTFEIDTDGNRSHISISVNYAKTGVTIILSGAKN